MSVPEEGTDTPDPSKSKNCSLNTPHFLGIEPRQGSKKTAKFEKEKDMKNTKPSLPSLRAIAVAEFERGLRWPDIVEIARRHDLDFRAFALVHNMLNAFEHDYSEFEHIKAMLENRTFHELEFDSDELVRVRAMLEETRA